MLQPKVLIIGAGAAGIAAASKLASYNVKDFKILESENRIGGRVFTTEFGGAPVDLGAQWVHGEKGNVCHKLGSAAELLADDSYGIVGAKCVFCDGTFMKDEAAWKLYCLCKETLEDEGKLAVFQGSLGNYFKESLRERLKCVKFEADVSEMDSFLEWFHRFQNSIDGSDSWFDTSASGTLEYHECKGNLLTRWKIGGYSNVLNLLMGVNSEKIKKEIVFNKTVERIHWDRKPLEVVCSDGQIFTADHVILTVSLGVLKENASSLFVPSLPQKKLQAIQSLGIGTVNKIFLKFPRRWWPTTCTGFSLLWKDEEKESGYEGDRSWMKEVFGFYSVDSSPVVMCGWVVGPASRHMEQCSDELVKDGCHQLLIKFLGKHYEIPPPDQILRSKWSSSPSFRGSYSFRSVATDEAGVTAADLASPLFTATDHPGLLFAGEATHEHFYSTVHGAIETGWREAERIISLHDKPSIRLPKSSL